MILKGKEKVNKSTLERTIMKCTCAGCDGELVAEYWHDETDDFYIYFKFNVLSFWKRVWLALKYIFRHENLTHGDVCSTNKEAKKFIKNLNAFLR